MNCLLHSKVFAHLITSPAEELAELDGGILTAEDIELYREQAGDVWPDSLSYGAQDRRDAALAVYAKGEMDFTHLSESLNTIYAN